MPSAHRAQAARLLPVLRDTARWRQGPGRALSGGPTQHATLPEACAGVAAPAVCHRAAEQRPPRPARVQRSESALGFHGITVHGRGSRRAGSRTGQGSVPGRLSATACDASPDLGEDSLTRRPESPRRCGRHLARAGESTRVRCPRPTHPPTRRSRSPKHEHSPTGINQHPARFWCPPRGVALAEATSSNERTGNSSVLAAGLTRRYGGHAHPWPPFNGRPSRPRPPGARPGPA